MKDNKEMNTGFKELLNSMMTRRWLITLIVLITFMFTAFGIMISIHMDTVVGQEWKELLLLLLGAFIGWNFPQPEFAKTIQAKILSLFKK